MVVHDVSPKWSTKVARVALFAVALVAASLVSLYLGEDSNWDLQNYHFYNPYAFLNDRIDWDIAPAQLQSYNNPLADLPFYWAVRADLPPRLIAILLALPAGITAFVLLLSLERLFGSLAWARWRLYVALALLIGVTGSAGVSLIGTTTNDWPPTMLIIMAIWLLLTSAEKTTAKAAGVIAFAGLIAGFATGLKLTAAPYAASLSFALLVTLRPFVNRAIARAAIFSGFALVGVIATCGYWLWRMYEKFDNPLFPYFNDWFRSPWWQPVRIVSGYEPRSVMEWLIFPFRLFRYNAGIVSELPFRDWRIPMVFASAGIALLVFALKRARGDAVSSILGARWEWRFVAVFWVGAFVFWAAEYSVYRYIVPLELLSGAMVILFLCGSIPSPARLAMALVITAFALAKTAYPPTWRVAFNQHFFAVDAPALPNDALVLLIGDAPLSYVIPFMNPRARFVGAKNNLVNPAQENLLAQQVRQVIGQHIGPLFTIQSSKGDGDEALSMYGLTKRADQCAAINTNMISGPLKLCELARSAVP